MTKLFDADGFKEILEKKEEVLRTGCPENLYGLFLGRVAKMVDLLPGVDAVPVIRCKDCNFYQRGDRVDGFGFCDNWDTVVSDEGFCSDGMKRVRCIGKLDEGEA